MKEKGFTLIELLAVIVILAVIALITVPMLMRVVDRARRAAFQDSVMNAFGQVAYYMIENETSEIPEAGLDIQKIGLKNHNFETGVFIKNEAGILEVVNVSDGKYCANGELTNLKITDGTCTEVVPVVQVTVTAKDANIVLEDRFAIVSYQITRSEQADIEWISIEPTTRKEFIYTASEAGTYYVHAKNRMGGVAVVSFEIDPSAFRYEATVTTSSYVATKTSQCVSSGACCPGAVAAGCPSSCSKNGGCVGSCYCNCNDTTCYPLGNCCNQYKDVYSCPNGGVLSGTNCVVTTYSCPNGGTLNGTMCEF